MQQIKLTISLLVCSLYRSRSDLMIMVQSEMWR